MLPAIWGLFIFCMVNTGGNIGLAHLDETSAASGANGWGWFFVYAINSGMGNTATLITNQVRSQSFTTHLSKNLM